MNEDIQRDAFIAGFKASGEGWNGEHGPTDGEILKLAIEYIDSIGRES